MPASQQVVATGKLPTLKLSASKHASRGQREDAPLAGVHAHPKPSRPTKNVTKPALMFNMESLQRRRTRDKRHNAPTVQHPHKKAKPTPNKRRAHKTRKGALTCNTVRHKRERGDGSGRYVRGRPVPTPLPPDTAWHALFLVADNVRAGLVLDLLLQRFLAGHDGLLRTEHRNLPTDRTASRKTREGGQAMSGPSARPENPVNCHDTTAEPWRGTARPPFTTPAAHKHHAALRGMHANAASARAGGGAGAGGCHAAMFVCVCVCVYVWCACAKERGSACEAGRTE
jgi:hypothetical protein